MLSEVMKRPGSQNLSGWTCNADVLANLVLLDLDTLQNITSSVCGLQQTETTDLLQVPTYIYGICYMYIGMYTWDLLEVHI
jgi:hypothetical protein